ncbi:MAG: ATP-binding protein [Kofleriaceae bacterium]
MNAVAARAFDEVLSTRLVSMSRTGRYAAVRAGDGGIEVVDVLGTAPRARIAEPATDFACVGTMLWALRGARIDRYVLGSARLIEPAIVLAHDASRLAADRSEAAHTAVACGARVTSLALGLHDRVSTTAVDARAVFPLGGMRVAAVLEHQLHLIDLGREPIRLGISGDLLAVHALHGGRVITALVRTAGEDTWWVVRPDGTRVHRVTTPVAERWAVATDSGVVLLAIDGGTRMLGLDLRYGRIRSEGPLPAVIDDLDVSADGQHVVLARRGLDAPMISYLPATELFAAGAGGRVIPAQPAREPVVDAHAVLAEPERVIVLPSPVEPTPIVEPVPPHLQAPPRTLPLALGAPLPMLIAEVDPTWPRYTSSREHLDDMLDLVAARAARAIAEAWNSGRLGVASTEGQPFEREVRGLIGGVTGFAASELGEAELRVEQMVARVAGRVRATLAAGIRLPFIELMRELDLSPVAGHVLMVAAAPGERGEIARLFAILGGDGARPVVDRHLIATILGGTDRLRRAEVATELADGSPLRRHAALQVSEGAISVDPVVIARLCDRAGGGRRASRALDDLCIPPATLRELVTAVQGRRPANDPLRLVLRGRRGSGRRSVLAALAAQIDRTVGEIDCARLPRAGAAMAVALGSELARCVLRGSIPIVSGLESADASDAEGHDRIRQVLRAHPGPVVIRAPLESTLPLDPGHATVTLPPLTETERGAFWRSALARVKLQCADVEGLAARWRVGPGVIEDVIAQAVTRRGPPGCDATATLDDVARQHIASRLSHIATPVRRLAAWENVALADDIIDSIREFIGRIAQRRTVLEQWGFDAKVASARGLTALFYGPPGTGKSMVAGLIARELGLELYRVDLARVVSKWIGETEKNLAEVFDAAEDGQVVILFDEADSLFARRTEVKSSVDRYANLEVNYLLQRLDSFEGIAILTTNLDGSIDPAFKRRMSLRLQFPFPDEDMRKRLWAAHIPIEAPTAGDFDFDALARRFPLSGGYIRNSTLRAAFLAAQERRPLAQEHLLRAIILEYRELGKLSNDGRME